MENFKIDKVQIPLYHTYSQKKKFSLKSKKENSSDFIILFYWLYI